MDKLRIMSHTRYFVNWEQTYTINENRADCKGSSQFTFRDESVALAYANAVAKEIDVKNVKVVGMIMLTYPVAIIHRDGY